MHGSHCPSSILLISNDYLKNMTENHQNWSAMSFTKIVTNNIMSSNFKEVIRPSHFRPGTDLISLLILLTLLLFFFFFLLLGATSSKTQGSVVSNRIGMKSGRFVLQVNISVDWRTGGVGLSIWRHTFKMADMTSFHAEKWCHLVSAHSKSARRICNSVRQFPASTSVHSSWSTVLVLCTFSLLFSLYPTSINYPFPCLDALPLISLL